MAFIRWSGGRAGAAAEPGTRDGTRWRALDVRPTVVSNRVQWGAQLLGSLMPVESRIGASERPFPRPLILAAIVAILSSVLLADIVPRYAPGLLRFEHSLADVRTSILSDQLPSQHPNVAIVGITDQTLSEYKT